MSDELARFSGSTDAKNPDEEDAPKKQSLSSPNLNVTGFYKRTFASIPSRMYFRLLRLKLHVRKHRMLTQERRLAQISATQSMIS
jgi:hypothetical protein